MAEKEKITHCVICNVPLPEDDIAENFETCVECDLQDEHPEDEESDDDSH